MVITVDRHCNHRFTVNLHGTEIDVTVTDYASVVKRWIHTTFHLRRNLVYWNRLVVGLGVQWTPGGRHPPADTLQLCVGRRCLIFQLYHANRIPNKLREFLYNPDHTFVGFWNHSDRRKLESSEHQFEMYRNPLDLRHHVTVEDEDGDEEDLDHASVSEIIERCLGYEVEDELSSEIGRSDWDDEDLSDEQVVYASIDAYCAYRIGKCTRAWKYA